jgi:superfamily I DNA and/or RNA helicase
VIVGLDASQLEALRRRLSNASPRVGGIVGPPGTGKTSTLAAEIADAVSGRGERVLMCAGQNATVDQTLLTVNTLLSERGFERDVIKRTGNLSKSDDYLVRHFATQRREEIMKAKVVFTTFHSSFVATGDPILNPNDFDRLEYDETGQATPEQAWIPLVLLRQGIDSKVSVYGDDRQLLPFSPDFIKEKGVLRYLRENTPDAVVQLNRTYRLPDKCVDMTSAIWYQGNLDAPAAVRSRRLVLERSPYGPFREIIAPENTLTYVGVRSEEESSGLSWDNHGQARVVGNLVTELISCGVRPSQIQVMAPYRPHVNSINIILEGTGVTCSTIHKKLGAENDVSIIASTRSNPRRAWGIAAEPELWNVGTSRQRAKLIIVGDSGTTFSEGTKLTRTIFDFVEHNGVVQDISL